jgi:hypothetical protein
MTGKAGWLTAVWVTTGLAGLPGCDKKDEASSGSSSSSSTMATAASSVAPSAPPPTAKVVKYTIAPNGKTSIDMPAKDEHIKGDTSAAAGELQIDLMNLANSRGEVKVDLTTLKTHTFPEPEKNASQNGHALNWLDVGEKVTPEVKEKNRWVTFEIRSVDGVSAADITKVPPEKTADGEVRTATLTAHGELFLHGHKANKDVPLEVKLHYPVGAAAESNPTSLDLTSKAPLHIVLADHEVKPPDPVGKLLQGFNDVLRAKVAETADVTLDLHATPAQ